MARLSNSATDQQVRMHVEDHMLDLTLKIPELENMVFTERTRLMATGVHFNVQWEGTKVLRPAPRGGGVWWVGEFAQEYGRKRIVKGGRVFRQALYDVVRCPRKFDVPFSLVLTRFTRTNGYEATRFTTIWLYKGIGMAGPDQGIRMGLWKLGSKWGPEFLRGLESVPRRSEVVNLCELTREKLYGMNWERVERG